MLTIHQRLLLKAERGAVLEAVSTPSGISAWWVPGTSQADEQDILRVPFGDAALRYRVTRPSDNRSVEWIPVDVPDFWKDCPVSFTTAEAAYPSWCHLDFTHAGYQDAVFCAECSYAWAQYLRSLKLLVEGGSGEPYGSAPSIAAGTTPPDF